MIYDWSRRISERAVCLFVSSYNSRLYQKKKIFSVSVSVNKLTTWLLWTIPWKWIDFFPWSSDSGLGKKKFKMDFLWSSSLSLFLFSALILSNSNGNNNNSQKEKRTFFFCFVSFTQHCRARLPSIQANWPSQIQNFSFFFSKKNTICLFMVSSSCFFSLSHWLVVVFTFSGVHYFFFRSLGFFLPRD